jgi:hypothetical protein
LTKTKSVFVGNKPAGFLLSGIWPASSL